MRHNIFRFVKLLTISMVSLMLLGNGWQGSPAHALPATNDPSDHTVDCLGNLQGSISTKDQSVKLWETSTLSWNVKVSTGCTGVKLYVAGVVVSPTGSRSIQPIADTRYSLQAVFRNGRRTLANTAIKVVLPPSVTISANSMTPLLVQALKDSTVKNIHIENQVELDLSGWASLPIQQGVTLAGGRTVREPGPLLYTTTIRPYTLFSIQGDNVRITGLRIQGPEMGVGETDNNASKGISINTQDTWQGNIEIDHNEIYGWSGAAVEVLDEKEKIDYVVNPETVRIHDNFIHHNQHEGTLGYGVVVSKGAYALIERNVFDWNRHAITSDGHNGSGYLAYRNLVLQNGGHQRCVLGVCWHTHQFDMHGQENCGIGDIFSDTLFNCGTAGEYMDIRYNSFLYTNGPAFKLRGTPLIGADVASNVFAHAALFTTIVQLGAGVSQTIPGALEQNESGLHQWDNQVGVTDWDEYNKCDFDGDGSNDVFLTTGQTWWYSSGGDRPWTYLNTSKKRLNEVTIGYFDGDNRCDVLVDGTIYPGGMPKKPLVKFLPPGRQCVEVTHLLSQT